MTLTMKLKKRLAYVGGTAAIVGGLVLGPAMAASATDYWVGWFGSQSACLTEQHKPAYNNSFARIKISCNYNQYSGQWSFWYTTR